MNSKNPPEVPIGSLTISIEKPNMFYGKIVYLQLTTGLIPTEKLKRLIDELNVPGPEREKMILKFEFSRY
jgi:hypothetical protein